VKRILITAPLRRKVEIFNAYQDALDKLIVPEGFSVDRFYVVNDCPEVIPHIRNASFIVHDSDPDTIQTVDHIWTGPNLVKMANLRNMTILYMLSRGYDYWLSIDTDLIVNEHTLEYLLAANKDIVAEIFWTMGPKGPWCNAWMFDDGKMEKEDLQRWAQPGLYQVGGTGALIMVKRRVFEAGVGYAMIPNIRKALTGEDRAFCVRAACQGFDIWLDTNAPAMHLFGDKEWNEYMNRREQHAERVQAGAEDHDHSV
jgi:hypothetical protein